MQSIKHTFHIDSDFDTVYNALNSIEDLSQWWTKDTVGGNELGDAIYFTFGEYATFEIQIAELVKNKLVNWKFIHGNPDWNDTFITFILSENDDKIMVQFVHEEFKDDYTAIGNINFSWGRYLSSLRDFCETGTGQPFE